LIHLVPTLLPLCSFYSIADCAEGESGDDEDESSDEGEDDEEEDDSSDDEQPQQQPAAKVCYRAGGGVKHYIGNTSAVASLCRAGRSPWPLIRVTSCCVWCHCQLQYSTVVGCEGSSLPEGALGSWAQAAAHPSFSGQVSWAIGIPHRASRQLQQHFFSLVCLAPTCAPSRNPAPLVHTASLHDRRQP
jgi:hypothetical protein